MSENREVVKELIDTDTGEVIQLCTGDRMKITKASDNSKPRLQRNYTNNHFVKQIKSGIKLTDYLTLSEIGFLHILSENISYGDCALRTNGDGNGKILTNVDLEKLTGLGERTVKEYIKSLKEKGFLIKDYIIDTEVKRGKRMAIILNPYIFCRGESVYTYILNKFKDKK